MADVVRPLGKASHPIPLPKQHGNRVFDAVTDKGTLYRHRHIDLVCNPASREIFIQRSRIIRGIRRYLDEEGFIEVETPIVGQAYGGAAARPFETRVNALDEQMFLRISPECALKRILCGGINKVYELGKNFRNEGIDASHNPEFTMVEWYEAYSDYLEQMVRFETLVARLCEEANGTSRITYRGRSLDLTPPWPRLPMLGALRDVAGIDVGSASAEDMPAIFAEHHPDAEDGLPAPLTWGGAVVALFEALVEPNLWDPVFVMDHPVEISPLTKRHRCDARLVERFEPMIAGMEVGNAYSELNDPVEQYNRLVSQQVSRDDTYDLDEEFLQAVAHGMPPAGGTGLGVDRIVMILTGAESIRDVVFFPFVSRRRYDDRADEDLVEVGEENGKRLAAAT
jgi:lysyl-tRNA synthetase class 2